MAIEIYSGKFKTFRKDLMITILFPPVLDLAAAREFDLVASEWLKAPDLVYVFDFSRVQAMDPVFTHSIGRFKTALSRISVLLCTIGSTPPIARQIRDEGLTSIFSPRKSVAEYLKEMNVSLIPSQLDVEFINPFVEATVRAMEIQGGTLAKVGKMYKVEDQDPLPTDLAGVMEIETKDFQGTVTLCFPEQVILDIYSNMMGEKFTEVAEPIRDAAAELLNIIMGNASAELDQKILRRDIPKICAGESLPFRHHSRGRILILPFFTDSGPFHLEISTETLRK